MTFKGRATASKQDFRDMIIDKVKNDYPLVVSSCTDVRACLSDKGAVINCPKKDRVRACAPHSYIIDGFRKICSKDQCRNQYRVHNSWRFDFQIYHDNGWVNEDSLYDAYTRYDDQMLIFLEFEQTTSIKKSEAE